jgi:hypothetical protein
MNVYHVTHCACVLVTSQAVNAMLAALPGHLQGLPKGHKGAAVGSRTSRASMGGPGLTVGAEVGQRDTEKGKGEGVYDGLPPYDENTSSGSGKAPVLRQSARVKQYTTKSAVSVSGPRLAPIFEDSCALLSPDNKDKEGSMAMMENPIAMQRRSSLKPSFLATGKEATYVPNLLEDDLGGLQSNAWMTI